MAAGAPTSGAIFELQRDINRLLDTPELERGTWGVLVTSLAHDDALYSLNARKLLIPASNMKLATLAAAAERLGWQYTYETRLVAFGSIHDRRLDGDLVVVGSGDPSIDNWDGAATRLFGTWAERLKAAGNRSVAGRIIGDDRAFADEAFGAGWAWDDLDRRYAAAVGALQFNENTAQLVVTPAAFANSPAMILLRPPTSGLIVQGGVTTTGAERRAEIAIRQIGRAHV